MPAHRHTHDHICPVQHGTRTMCWRAPASLTAFRLLLINPHTLVSYLSVIFPTNLSILGVVGLFAALRPRMQSVASRIFSARTRPYPVFSRGCGLARRNPQSHLCKHGG